MNTFIEVKASKMSLAKRKPIYGIGINDAWYNSIQKIAGKNVRCPIYRKWTNMLKRCYSEKYHEKRATYIGCSVCKDWLTFSNFRSWMIKQDWNDKQLDKDLLVQGNKVYSPSTCLFVSVKINNLLNDCGATRGMYPQGVYWNDQHMRFLARISINNKQKTLGEFHTPESASKCYVNAKYDLIKEVALKQNEPLRSALLRYKIES